jgi:hypothetical protein
MMPAGVNSFIRVDSRANNGYEFDLNEIYPRLRTGQGASHVSADTRHPSDRAISGSLSHGAL